MKWLLAYRTGGDFEDTHVYEAVYNIRRFYPSIPIVVYTDSATLRQLFDNMYIMALTDNEATGWWCKLELFRREKHAIYTDLDVLITDNTIDLLTVCERVDQDEFVSLQPFSVIHGTEFAKLTLPTICSSVMLWKGDFSCFYYTWDSCVKSHLRSDQDWLGSCLIRMEYNYSYLQNSCQVKSYRNDWLHGDRECDILSFHGKPRPTLDYLKTNEPELYKLRNYK